MAVTRIKNNQITDSTVNAAAKLADYTITAGKIANNLTYGSDLTITGNLTVNGNVTTIDTIDLVVEDPLILLAKNQTGSPTLDIGFIGKRGTSDNIAFVWDENQQVFVTAFTTSEVTNTTITINSYASFKTLNATVTGNLDVTGNITLGNIVGNITVDGNVTADNFLTAGIVSATGNVTGGNINTAGAVSATGNVNSGNVNTTLVAATTLSASGNVTGGNVLTGGLISAGGTVTGSSLLTGGVISATGTVTGGNLATGGTISGTGNITGGNVLTGGLISATGNVNSGNVNTTLVAATTISASGNVTGGNVLTGGLISAAANITGGNILTGGAVSATGNGTFGNISTAGSFSAASLSATGNITGGNLLTGGLISAGGTVTGSSVLTGGVVSATGTITGGNLATGGTISGTGNITGGNIITAGLLTATGNINSGANIVATANVIGGNLRTAGQVSAAGNITTAASLITTQVTTASGDLVLNSAGGALQWDGTGNIVMNSQWINNLSDPTQAQDAATKQYVDDAVSTGITIHTPVRLESPTSINGTYAQGGTTATVTDTVAGNTVVFGSAISPQVNDQYWFTNSFQGILGNTPYFVVSAPNTSAAVLSLTYSGAPVTDITSASGLTQPVRINSGQGATLTNAGANATLVIDGVTTVNGDRLLIYTQSNAAHNGVYDVTEAGNATTAWQLTRSSDMDTYIPNDINGLDAGDYFYVQEGDTGAGESYVLTAPVGPTIIGYANITFTQFSASQVYSANTAAGLTLTGTVFSAKVDNDTTAFDGGGNISVKAGANLVTPNIGAATGTSLSVTGNVTGGNINTGGLVSATANITGGNILTGGLVSATANVTGGNLVTAGLASVAGNVIGGNVTTAGLVSAGGTVTGSSLLTGGTVSAAGTVTGSSLLTGGTVSATGNVTGGNVLTGGLISATGNINSGANIVATANVIGGNLTTAGQTVATGNITGGNILTGGLISATGNGTFGNINTTLVSATTVSTSGNVTGGNLLTGGLISATGNITGGNVITGGLVNATGTVTGSSLLTGGLVSATGNVTGGNILTGGVVSAASTVTGSSLLTGGTVSATGTITGGNLVTAGNGNIGNIRIAGDDITGTNGAVTFNDAGADVNFRFEGDTDTNLLVLDAGTDTVNIGTATPVTGAKLNISATSSMIVPVGNTSQRPGTGSIGMFRFNTIDDALEVYTSAGWEAVGVPAFTVIADDQFTGDGSTVQFTLGQDSTTAATIVSINGVVQIPTTAYSVSGNVLTFTEAPISTDVIDARTVTTTTTVIAISNTPGNAVIAVSETADTIQTTGNIIPTSNVAFNLGSDTFRFNDLYLAGNSIFLGNTVLKNTTGNSIGFFGPDGTTPATIDAASVDTTQIASGTSSVAVISSGGNIRANVAGATVATISSGGVEITGNLSVTGNATLSGNILGDRVQNGTTSFDIQTQNGNANITVGGTSNVAVFATTGAYITGLTSVTGNVIGGNLLTGGLISATGTITGSSLAGTLTTAAQTNITSVGTLSSLSVTGNVQGGNLRTAGLISATGAITGAAITGSSLTVTTGNVTAGNIVNGNANGVGNIGSSTTYFNTVFAKATSAQYADLAEMYVADADYNPGTVLSFGGPEEVTLSVTAADDRVAGVVSTNPSYLMNSALEGEHTVALALTGRVPTRVTGRVRKGDMMVSNGDGTARAEPTPRIGTVIGKAVEDFDGGSGVIEVVIGRL